jgi:hypothetical protein
MTGWICDVRFTPESGHRRESLLVTALARIFLTKSSSFLSSRARSSAVRAFTALVDDMRSKTDQIRTAWAAGDEIGALRIAAQFFDRSPDTRIFKRGMDAHNHPQFYRQIGKEPQELVAAALEILARRFDLRWSSVIQVAGAADLNVTHLFVAG